MSQTWEDLPFECWEAIFSQIQNPSHLQPLSLVSKSLLSATNSVRSSLTIDYPTVNILSRLLLRFPNLRHITVKTTESLPFDALDALVRSLAASNLRLQSLDLSGQEQIPIFALHALGRGMRPALRILSCRNLHFLRDSDLIAIADSFPSLEVLDIAHPQHDITPQLCPTAVTNFGIAELSSKLRNLRSLDVSGNSFLSDSALIAISRNCKQIAEVRACDCCFMTCDGVRAVIRLCSNLISLSVNKCSIPPFTECVSRVLSCLELPYTSISDEWLFSLVAAALPLRKIALPSCQGFTFAGISALLSHYRSLQHLDLERAAFLTDSYMVDLLGLLRSLIYVNLNSCPRLKNPTFFGLVRSCPSLEEISMESCGLGKDDYSVELVKNHRTRTLKLAGNRSLSDETLKTLGSVCPRLLSLDVSGCCSITEMGISEIGKRCPNITELKMVGCRRLQNLGTDGRSFQKLEVLMAGGTGMEDEGLTMLGKQGCGALRVLDLEGCSCVTEMGIKKLLRSNGGKGLKEFNLRRCCKVNKNVLAWMVFSGPSLKKIIPPTDYIPGERQQQLFLRHGCMVG